MIFSNSSFFAVAAKNLPCLLEPNCKSVFFMNLLCLLIALDSVLPNHALAPLPGLHLDEGL